MNPEKDENDGRNYLMIDLHKSMGPGRDDTRDPWICSQTRICCQTRYWLRYAGYVVGVELNVVDGYLGDTA